MRYAIWVALLLSLAVSFSGFPEEPEKLTEKAKKIVIQPGSERSEKQEYVEVRGKRYNWLAITTETMADQLTVYRPNDTRELVSPLDLQKIYNEVDWNRAIGARPYRTGRLVQVGTGLPD
jgi:hypothetical protein